jgi:diguanylate cyclase (GGDEF)-like protein/PAS domain S-box-containing protein
VEAHGRPTLDAEQLLAVLDGVSVLLYVQDPDSRIAYVNESAGELIGKSPAEIVGRMPAELFDPATVERWTAQNEHVLRTGRPLDVEDGWGGRTYLTHKTPVFDAEGRPLAVIGLSTEITEQKRAEEALRRRESQLNEAQRIAGVGSWHWDAATGAVEWSPELRELFAIPAGGEPGGSDALEVVHPDDRERIVEATSAVLRDGGALDLEMRIVRPDGQVRLMRCRAGVTRGPDGATRRLDGTCEDITDRRRAEQRLDEAQRLGQIGSFDRDLDDDEVHWSPETYRIFGVDPEHLVPSRENVFDQIVPEDRERLRDEVDGAVRDEGGFDCFVTIQRPDGERRDLRVRGAVHRVAGGPRHLIGICQDLTDIRAAERERTELAERFRVVFERAPVGMALVGRGGRFELVNEALCEFMGRDDLVGARVEDVTHPDDMAASADAMRRMAAGELGEWNTEKRYVRAGGEVRWGALRAVLLHDAEGRSTHCLALLRDVTGQRLAERRRAAAHGVLSVMASGRDLRDALPALLQTVVEELGWERGALWRFATRGEPGLEAAWPRGTAGSHPSGRLKIPVMSDGDEIGLLEFECEPREHAGEELESFAATLGAQVGEFIVRRMAEEKRLYEALHDPLTGLPNRVLFFDRLDHAMRRQRREHAPLAVLFLDFDGFKAVNDRFGHAAGDRVLRLAAAAVASSLRGEDTVARFGGDELVVLSEHITGARDAIVIAERILETLRAPLPVDGAEIALTASIGICLAPVEGRSREELLASADRAMYLAKAGGPGRYALAED